VLNAFATRITSVLTVVVFAQITALLKEPNFVHNPLVLQHQLAHASPAIGTQTVDGVALVHKLALYHATTAPLEMAPAFASLVSLVLPVTVAPLTCTLRANASVVVKRAWIVCKGPVHPSPEFVSARLAGKVPIVVATST